MIVVLKPNTPRDQIDAVIEEVQRLGYEARPIFGAEQTVIAAIGDERTHHTLESLSALPQVEKVMRVQKRYKMVSRESHPANSVVDVAGVPIGGQKFVLMAGPCSVESEEQLLTTARAVKAAGATVLRGGAYKPRTSPYEFQGLGQGRAAPARSRAGGNRPEDHHRSPLRARRRARRRHGRHPANRRAQCAEFPASHRGRPQQKADPAQARPISQKIEEWLLGAEYIMAEGNANVLLCERGIRTFETYTRNTLDLAAVAVAKKESHLPVIVDPSQGCGRADLVRVLCQGAVAVGADGLLIEVHPHPAEALAMASSRSISPRSDS